MPHSSANNHLPSGAHDRFPRYRSRQHRMKDAARQCGVEYSTLWRAINYLNGRTDIKSARAPSRRLEAAIRQHCPQLLHPHAGRKRRPRHD